MAGLQDLQDRGMGLAGGCLDRITGLQDIQDKLCWAKLGVKNGQDYWISGLTG